jgi:hypothetical protein
LVAKVDNDSQRNLSLQTRTELERAREATAKYNDINVALHDNFIDINVFIPHMGFHYLNLERKDDGGVFDPEKPELLVYAQDLCEGRLRLVAVEYGIPLNFPRPEGFTGDADVWEHDDEHGLWTLHAWLWYQNPDGVFAPFNPRVP